MARQSRKSTVVRAKILRQSMSLPEVLLWQRLCANNLGLKFRRQHPLGPFIVDFYLPAAKLVIEIDGGTHDGAAAQDRDAQRDNWITNAGYSVLRVTAREILADVDAMADGLLRHCYAATTASVACGNGHLPMSFAHREDLYTESTLVCD